jgi:hypothetical protein
MKTTQAKITLYERERTALTIAVGFFCVALFSYMYFLSASVMHVVVRKEVDREYVRVASEVGALESEYIEVQHSVSEDIASLHGFVKTDAKIFIDRSARTFSLRTE